MTVQLGSPVIYVLRDGPSAGQSRPAVITRTWGSEGKDPTCTPGGVCVQLAIFLDGANDGDAEKFASSATYDDNTCPPGSWQFPSEKIL